MLQGGFPAAHPFPQEGLSSHTRSQALGQVTQSDPFFEPRGRPSPPLHTQDHQLSPSPPPPAPAGSKAPTRSASVLGLPASGCVGGHRPRREPSGPGEARPLGQSKAGFHPSLSDVPEGEAGSPGAEQAHGDQAAAAEQRPLLTKVTESGWKVAPEIRAPPH